MEDFLRRTELSELLAAGVVVCKHANAGRAAVCQDATLGGPTDGSADVVEVQVVLVFE